MDRYPSPQPTSEYRAYSQPQLRDDRWISPGPDSGSFYPTDDNRFQTFNQPRSQDYQYEQTPFEPRDAGGFGGLTQQYRFLEPNRNYDDSRNCEGWSNRYPVQFPAQNPSFTQQPPQYQETDYSRTSPYSQPTSPSIGPSDQEFLSQALDFTKRTAPINSRIRRLDRSIAIPQTAPGIGKSYLRAWAPVLQYHDISIIDLVSFIDNLNIVSTASPPLQVLDIAGGIVGLVPHHLAQIASVAMQGTAKLGKVLVSKGRTEMFMTEVNERMFHPRGLKASLASTEVMRTALRIPADRPALGTLTAQTMNMSTVERTLMEVAQYNAVLDLNVPPVAEQVTMLAKMSAKQITMQASKNQKKVLKKREKDVRKQDKRSQKDERKGRESRRKDGKKNKEEKNAEKLLWIMIENL